MYRKIFMIVLFPLLLILLMDEECSADTYTIQTGLFRKETNALRLVEMLKKKFPDLEPFMVRKGKFILVKAGPFRSRKEALAVVKAVRQVSKDAYIEKIEPPRAGKERKGIHTAEKGEEILDDTLLKVKKLVLKGRYNEAIEQIKKGLEKHPENQALHGWYGTALLKSGDPEAALPWFRKAIYLDKTIPDYHNGAGYCLLATGRLFEAISEFTLALKLKPDYDDALAGLGYVYVSLGKKDEALAVYNRLKKINQEMADLLFRRIILM